MKDSVPDVRLQIKDNKDYHIELFTKYPEEYKTKDYIFVKMGFFRARREDNSIGERYYVSDVREQRDGFNAIIVYRDYEKDLLAEYDINPRYNCERLDVYRYGEYKHLRKPLLLTVDSNGFTVTNIDF